MADWIYCGSNAAVDAAGTQSLLRTHQAIWCPPPGLRLWPGTPHPGERLWLVWHAAGGPILLLGGGRLAQNNQARFGTDLLHTNSDILGVRDAAENLGYRGGTAMSFLILEDVAFPAVGQPPVAGLGVVPTALSKATPTQSTILNGVLPDAKPVAQPIRLVRWLLTRLARWRRWCGAWVLQIRVGQLITVKLVLEIVAVLVTIISGIIAVVWRLK
jgi:hypothetical protein